MDERKFQQAEAEGVARRVQPLSPRQLIASVAADDVIELAEHDCLDKSAVELIIMSALVQAENMAHERWLGELGRALKERRSDGLSEYDPRWDR